MRLLDLREGALINATQRSAQTPRLNKISGKKKAGDRKRTRCWVCAGVENKQSVQPTLLTPLPSPLPPTDAAVARPAAAVQGALRSGSRLMAERSSSGARSGEV
eukprot:6193311-Pleurochrysis_carterae.AAC.3